jgi:hypothetical protein
MAALARQRCLHHSSREAIARCLDCRQFFCRECITEHDERLVCASCLKKVAQAAAKPARRRVNLWPLLQTAAGLLLAVFFFYLIGSALLALPDSFHDGSLWEQSFLDSLDSE